MKEYSYLSLILQILVILLITVVLIFIFRLKLFHKTIRSKSIDLQILENQSIELEDGIRTSPLMPDGDKVECELLKNVNTVYKAFLRGLDISKEKPFIGELKNGIYHWKSYDEVYNLCRRFGTALVVRGLKSADHSSIVAVYSRNCLKWNIVAEACSMYSFVFVPICDTLRFESYRAVICDLKVKVLVVEDWSRCLHLVEKLSYSCSLQYIVIMNDEDTIEANYLFSVLSKYEKQLRTSDSDEKNVLSQKAFNKAASLGIKISTFDAMLKLGRVTRVEVVPPSPNFTCMILYGKSDAAVAMSHGSVMKNIEALFINDHWGKILPNESDSYLSFLPAAHAYERVNQIIMMLVGGRMAFGSGKKASIAEDMALLRPTFLVTVPRFLNRIYEQVHVSHPVIRRKKEWFNYGMQKKMELLQKGVVRNDTVWDYLLFFPIQNLLGGRLRVVISGGAPLTSQVLNFVRATFGCHVFEGYGLTEFGGAVTLTMSFETQCGVVGAPLPNCLFKLVDRLDMGYLAANGVGEICIKSNFRMTDYFLRPNLSRSVFDADGFFRTGDIGKWTPNGCLRVVERCRPVFKLSQAEDVDPEYVERVYLASSYIAQIFVDGIATEDYPVAVVVPDLLYARWKSFENKTVFGDEINQQLLKNEIVSTMKDLEVKERLLSFERVKGIHLYLHEFTVTDGLLTPSHANNRTNLRRFFRSEINQLYHKLKKAQH